MTHAATGTEVTALRTIAEMPIAEQDNMVAANMRAVAVAALAQQAAQAPDEAVERLMGLALDLRYVEPHCGNVNAAVRELRHALSTALSQAVPQAGGLSDADVPDLLVEAVTAGLFPMSKIMDDDLQQSLLTYSRAILARAGAVEGSR